MQHFTTPNTSGLKNSCTYIMLHHTATGAGTVQSIMNSRKKPWGLSCHYIVDENGQVYSFNTEKDVLWHAGKWSLNGIVDNMNSHAIGIEVIGPLAQSGDGQFTEAQRKSVSMLIKDIATRNWIKKENIIRHKDYTDRKVDIYDTFWNKTHKTRTDYVQKILGLGDKPETVKVIMELNSKRWNETEDWEEKAVLESVNSYYRNKFR